MIVHERKNIQITPAQREGPDAVHEAGTESGHRGARGDIESEDMRRIKKEFDWQEGKEGQRFHVSEGIFSEKHSEDGKESFDNGH